MLTFPSRPGGPAPAGARGEPLHARTPGGPLDEQGVAELLATLALTPSAVGPVGLELERHVVDTADPTSRVPWDRLTGLVAGVHPPAGSRVTLEPGGQVELSTAPEAGVVEAVAALRADVAHLDAVFAADGLVLLGVGGDPVRAPRRVNPGPRYTAMAEHFAATGFAEDGAAMMCSTASLQVNLDAGPRAQWGARVAHLDRLVPVLVAMAACSPLLGGAETGDRSARQRVWQRLEPGRCAQQPSTADGDPVASWVDFALAAPVMFVAEPDGRCEPVRGDVGLGDWAAGRRSPVGRPPTAADVVTHLTTLWPPVRLRGFLELRVLDTVPAAWWPGLAAVVATVVDDPRAADAAAEAAEPVAGRAVDAARVGTTDPDFARAARGVVQAALGAVPGALRPEVEAWADLLAAGRGPADLVLDRARRSGPVACLTAEELR